MVKIITMFKKAYKILSIILISAGLGSLIFAANVHAFTSVNYNVVKESDLGIPSIDVIANSALLSATNPKNIITKTQIVKKTVATKSSVTPKTEAKKCVGEWFKTSNMVTQINLGRTEYSKWNPFSSPAVVGSTLNASNTVLLGHNPCKNGNCNAPLSKFSQIMNAKVGSKGSACLSGKYYEGEVVFSNKVSKNAVDAIEGYWQGGNVITALTCYGNCEDEICSSTDQRWVMSFRKS